MMKAFRPTSQPRRAFLKSCVGLSAAQVLPYSSLLSIFERDAAAQHPSTKTPEVVASANPMVGTGWRGHMFPGATLPFGLVQLSPDTSGPSEPHWNVQGDWYEWQHCSGYNYRDNVINGFTHTHVQGTGGVDLGDVLIMPMVEGLNWSWQAGRIQPLTEMQTEALGSDSGIVFSPSELGYRSFFSHEHEIARPGYYSVQLDTPRVQAELTATTRCGMHRYRYMGSTGRQGLIVDLVHGLNCRVQDAELTIESNGSITGRRSTTGWARDRTVFFALDLSDAAESIDVSVDGTVTTARAGDRYAGKEIKVIFTRRASQEPLIARVGISPVSIEGARKNLRSEIAEWDFDAVAQRASHDWTEILSGLRAESFDPEMEKTFYSDAYHSFVAPATYNDVDGSFRGQDLKTHSNPGFTKYTTLSIWDIYRGQFPFLTITQPNRINDIVRTLLTDYDQLGQHALPMWPLWANETWSMVGFHAAAMILGAYVRGFRDFDVQAAYAAVRDTALVGAEARGNRELQAMFRQYGYVPYDLHPGSVSSTLDLSYDYWCAGALARLLGKTEDSEMFLKLARNYRNVFNPGTGFMEARSKDGQWRTPFRPDQETDDYVETDAWQASFSVPHDVHGLIQLYGGDEAFIEKLDGLFTAPSTVLDARPDITGMVGQDAQGNEPSNHHPYLFSFAGAPWKTQFWTRKVAALYNATPAGIPGNDDCGQLASWFVFAALGFYPVNAANGVYVLGSPLLNRAEIRNPANQSTFTIVADNNSATNMYIQQAQLNGKELHRSWITHQQIAAGGELRLRMGPSPNKSWGSASSDRPPSELLSRE
ncbi:MAG TPA: GH92 family glycosyl hydrolase [Bryocella sp.]|nr:GH92 family glycosyl hydrolase [Bryocella sp.]